jgi:hypothetical protein
MLLENIKQFVEEILNDLLDLVNDIEPASKLQHDDLFEIATSLTTIRDKVVKEFLI